MDVFANDLGFIAIEKNGKLKGFNVCVGGGLGSTLGNHATYPRLADVIGYVRKENMIHVAETVITVQRDFGNRVDRKNARLKYTIDKYGLNWFISQVNERLGWEMDKPAPFQFETNGDSYGWQKGTNDKWFYTLFIEHGKVKDKGSYKLKTALREIAHIHTGDFRLTGNQNLILANVETKDKDKIESILKSHGVIHEKPLTGLRLSSMACVALNTCGLAFAESERYLPLLVDKLDVIIRQHGLERNAINIRMTGCPNGCARSALGEIGFVGRAIGRYNLYLGASHNGDRLNTLYKEMLSEEEILAELEPMIAAYAAEKRSNEYFGDFVIRKNIVKSTTRPLQIIK